MCSSDLNEDSRELLRKVKLIEKKLIEKKGPINTQQPVYRDLGASLSLLSLAFPHDAQWLARTIPSEGIAVRPKFTFSG